MATAGKKVNETLLYRGKPLLRSGNVLYYGRMSDPYIVEMQILDTKKVREAEVAGRISVTLLKTDTEMKPTDRIVKQSEKTGLYNAMDIASVWLDRALPAN